MFKAKLIENENYYKLRGRGAFFMLLFNLPFSLLFIYRDGPIWLITVLIVLSVLSIFLMYRNIKSIKSIFGNSRIEIDDNEIRIISSKEAQSETINLKSIDKLIVKDRYSMLQEKIKVKASKGSNQEMAGKVNQSYLILQQDSEKRKIHFEADSNFMLIQLDKLIDSLESKGHPIYRNSYELI